jgi:hypothetical protein
MIKIIISTLQSLTFLLYAKPIIYQYIDAPGAHCNKLGLLSDAQACKTVHDNDQNSVM